MSNKYLVSVVTPFHNVDMDMFKNAYASIKKQTIGFKNIQWIVVVHNSDKEYLEAVEKLIGDDDNVLIKELNNDAHTPSSPRNYGMKFAEGEYLAFLDGDDSFTPFALEVTVSKAKAHKAEVVVFRREYELENENLTTVTEVTLWNQTLEEVVMDRAHWDTEKMFSGIWGMVTSRLFNTQFLNDNNISFDESIPFAEDMDFVVSVYTYADIVVYLPQTIGYHYFINGGSLMQSLDKPGETLVGYAKGFAKIFEKIMSMGVYADSSVNGLCMFLAQYIVNSTSITLEQKEAIRDALEPYLDATGKTIVNKTCSKEESEVTYFFPREIILNPDSKRSGYSLKAKWDGADVLGRILHEGSQTDYGTRYQFSIIQTPKGYQARVPLADIESYKILSDLQMKIGETGIITSKETPLFLSNTFNTGAKNYCLATKEYLDKIGTIFVKQMIGKTNALFMISRLPVREFNAYATDINSSMLTYYNTLRYSLQANGTEVVSPDFLLFPQEKSDITYYQALFALAAPNVEQIIAPSCWRLCEIFDCIKSNWEMMVGDLDNGIVSGPNIKSEKLKRVLNAAIVADPDRAAALKKIFNEGVDASTIKKIWPDLSEIRVLLSASNKLYKDRLSKYFEGINIMENDMITPEGIIGIATGEDGIFKLCKDDIFYEFIPFEDRTNASAKTVFVSDLELSKKYIVVLTNSSGLYRYNSKMVIEVVKNDFDDVRFCFCGYIDEYFVDGDFCFGESEAYEQIEYLNRECNARITDFAYIIEDRIFKLYFETEDNKGISADECVKVLRAHYNPKYFENIEAYNVDCGSQLLYRELVCYKNNSSSGRFMPIRLITTVLQKMFFEGCVLKEGDD